MKNKFILALLVVNLFVAAVYASNRVMKRYQEKQELQQYLNAHGEANEKAGLGTKADYLKLNDLRTSIPKAGVVSDKDFSWILARENEAISSTKDYSCLPRTDYATLICSTKHLTAQQKEAAYKIAVTIFNLKKRPGSQENLDFITACNLIIVLKDSRAVPYLLPLTTHPNEDVRGRAQQALSGLGYSEKPLSSK